MREQVCIAICPYGRLQSVMLDKDSIVVAYDFERGEPRGKIRKNRKKKDVEEQPEVQLNQNLGDCIDCDLCVKVCPTGIDIRNGTQLECINCTACMDACDEVMLKIGREQELIRYDSLSGIEKGHKKLWTPRVMAYSGVLSALIVLEIFLFALRTDVETLLLRTPGLLFQEVNETTISNLYNYQVINKTSDEYKIEFRLEVDYGEIKLVGEVPLVKKNNISKGGLFIEMPKDKLKSGKNTVVVEVYSEGKMIDKVKTSFLGPVK
jgi:cytochrome c oxidase accessory protein FixG